MTCSRTTRSARCYEPAASATARRWASKTARRCSGVKPFAMPSALSAASRDRALALGRLDEGIDLFGSAVHDAEDLAE